MVCGPPLNYLKTLFSLVSLELQTKLFPFPPTHFLYGRLFVVIFNLLLQTVLFFANCNECNSNHQIYSQIYDEK